MTPFSVVHRRLRLSGPPDEVRSRRLRGCRRRTQVQRRQAASDQTRKSCHQVPSTWMFADRWLRFKNIIGTTRQHKFLFYFYSQELELQNPEK